MLPHLDDTIVALSSASGPGARAVVRLSGPGSLTALGGLFTADETIDRNLRRRTPGQLHLSDVATSLPADLYFWPAPHTYTGQDVVELHTISCVPFVELLIAQLLQTDARTAQPGEFTMRAFLAGKLDLTRAEAVLGVIEAGTRDELAHALKQLAGGMAQPLHALRDDLLNLLADLEAGLDFAEEDIHFIAQDELLKRLSKGLAQLLLLQKQLAQRTVSGRPFRVVLAGRPNAGKSSLFNALAGERAALVSAEPGTTRDYLLRRLTLDDVIIEVADTAGRQPADGTIEQQAQTLASEQADQADLLLLCVEAGQMPDAHELPLLERHEVVGVATKCDLAPPPSTMLATSAVSGTGLATLRTLLAERTRAYLQPALAPSVSRCRHHVDACLERLRHAHELVLFEEAPELLALEVRGALDELGALVGAVYTDDLLDRIFSRFCIGK